MRAIAILAFLLLHGCAFTQLREDLPEFYAKLEGMASQVVSGLDAPAFLESNGRKGLWQPLSFVQEKRGGVYLLEAYDPNKVPVLFIHGAGGTPQDWRFFIEKLDRSKYQPWLYYYPTGLPIDVNAGWLNNLVAGLHGQYSFRQLAIAAHSMGGLVARRFLALSAKDAAPAYSTLLATFSTPYGGVPVARVGLALGSYAVPSWRDLAPDSDFLRSLRKQSLPPTVRQHVFVAYREDGDDFDSDGVISVASQREKAFIESAQVQGFKTDHSDILDSPTVFTAFSAALAGFN